MPLALFPPLLPPLPQHTTTELHPKHLFIYLLFRMPCLKETWSQMDGTNIHSLKIFKDRTVFLFWKHVEAGFGSRELCDTGLCHEVSHQGQIWCEFLGGGN
jgi:hypothetical protein